MNRPAAVTCFACNAVITVTADDKPVALEKCPICDGPVCTCPEGTEGHKQGCALEVSHGG